jgi:hypothetical protein
MPFSTLSIILGSMTLAALALFGSGAYLGLGAGGIERMIAYPALMWEAGFGDYHIAHPEERRAEQNRSNAELLMLVRITREVHVEVLLFLQIYLKRRG